jgi:hypothetical protein
MPHQRLIADIALEIDPATGRLAYSQVIVIGPRQATGKTELLLPVMTHRCTGFDESLTRWVREHLGIALAPPGSQRVLYTAQTADDARKKWRDVHLERLRASSYFRPRPQFSARLTTNKEALLWRNGSAWSPGSTTGKTGGTGDTLDLGVIDEAWSRTDARTELGMLPAMMTRGDWRQLWVTSMIPGISRAAPGTWSYLAGKRRVGRELVAAGVKSGVALFDFTAAEDADPDDPATWFSCMPGLGRTVGLEVVAADHATWTAEGNAVDFQAEYLGWAPKETVARWGLLARQVWEVDRMDPTSSIVGDVALGIEVSEDRRQAWIGAAGRRADRDWHVEVIEPGYLIPEGTVGIDWVVRRVVAVVLAQDVCTIVVDKRRPAFALVATLRAALDQAGRPDLKILTPDQAEMGAACGRFYDAAGGVRGGEAAQVPAVGLWHLGQRALSDAVAQARRFELGIGAFVFVKRGQSGDIGPLYAVVEAMHGHELLSTGEPYPASEGIDLGGSCPRCGRSTYLLADRWCHAMDDTPECGT